MLAFTLSCVWGNTCVSCLSSRGKQGSSLREGQGGGGIFTQNVMTRQLASKKGATLNGVKDLFHFNTDWLPGAPALG